MMKRTTNYSAFSSILAKEQWKLLDVSVETAKAIEKKYAFSHQISNFFQTEKVHRVLAVVNSCRTEMYLLSMVNGRKQH